MYVQRVVAMSVYSLKFSGSLVPTSKNSGLNCGSGLQKVYNFYVFDGFLVVIK